MIIEMSQRRSDLKLVYEFVHNGILVCTSYSPARFIGMEIRFIDTDGRIYKLEDCLSKDMKRVVNSCPMYKSYSIKDSEDRECGRISLKRSSFWFGYLYYEILFNGKIYTAYEVGRGKEGLYLTVFDNTQQAALIEKDIKVKDYKDTYTIYLKNEGDKNPIMFFNVLYDSIRWSNSGHYGYRSTKYNYVRTFNKFVNSTYDPAFKDTIEY